MYVCAQTDEFSTWGGGQISLSNRMVAGKSEECELEKGEKSKGLE